MAGGAKLCRLFRYGGAQQLAQLTITIGFNDIDALVFLDKTLDFPGKGQGTQSQEIRLFPFFAAEVRTGFLNCRCCRTECNDAKLGIFIHWGIYCVPAFANEWYARNMYIEGSKDYQFHREHYGHPSKVGFKDIIHRWQAAHFEPNKLLAFYKQSGAKYFMALANHHDNFDNFNSMYQPWNSVALGPKKDLIGMWATAARKNDLRFAVSVHGSRAWSWYEVAQRADTNGSLAGVPYDGKLTKADGKGTWWEGYDPQDLYEQRHAPSPDFQNLGRIHSRWNWGNGITPPTEAYCRKFLDRTLDLIDRYEPDLVYFDDTALPFWPINDVGLRIAAHYYNGNMRRHGGALEAVIFGKILDEQQRRCMVWDIERGQANEIQPLPWQTDTCVGHWHYDRRARYKTPKTVIDKLSAAIQQSITEPDFRKRMADLGSTVYAPEQSTPAALGAQLKSEVERWSPVIKAAGVYAD